MQLGYFNVICSRLKDERSVGGQSDHLASLTTANSFKALTCSGSLDPLVTNCCLAPADQLLVGIVRCVQPWLSNNPSGKLVTGYRQG